MIFPAALSGIVASVVLAISRALGETMIVSSPAATPNFTLNPVESIQTMTAYIATTATATSPPVRPTTSRSSRSAPSSSRSPWR